MAAISRWLKPSPQVRDLAPNVGAFLQALEDDREDLLRDRDTRRIQFPRVFSAYETRPFRQMMIVEREWARTRCDANAYPNDRRGSRGGRLGASATTADIDVTLGGEADRLEALAAGAERVGLTIDREWQPLLRDRHRRLTGPGVVVDLMRPRDDHEDQALGRRRHVSVGPRPLPFVAPEDLILMKLKAGRPHDFEDALSVLVVQRQTIDERYLVDWARRLGIADELGYVLGQATG